MENHNGKQFLCQDLNAITPPPLRHHLSGLVNFSLCLFSLPMIKSTAFMDLPIRAGHSLPTIKDGIKSMH
jgi:hypothetical protein